MLSNVNTTRYQGCDPYAYFRKRKIEQKYESTAHGYRLEITSRKFYWTHLPCDSKKKSSHCNTLIHILY